ncbi:DUF2971 domain-containing protein [Sinorhizobium meliloti]|uniref:DUF2971 domain-containing protein n=1 Tax=Rhizobium meliloti TaxID=382 RepID=UPI000FDA8BE4|nr:DUF2971 domain-containing protein [Sinorhizobium meliloti]RVG30688.1 DUF2971 domain-containing protein [Sinorhizobium meliloti]
MKKTTNELLSGTNLRPVLPRLPRGRLSGGKNFGSSAIRVERLLECPELTGDQLAVMDDGGPDYITRHMDERHLNSALAGYFQFGTLARYRGSDMQLNVGRFSDLQEGTQRNAFESRNGYFKNAEFGSNIRLDGIHISGFEASVLVEFQINDYCSCSSMGEYNAARADEIRDNGNPELGAYATYDLKKLRLALDEIVTERTSLAGHVLVGREVLYGEKDRRWMIEDYFELKKHRDPLAIWMGTAFVKSQAYEHENEFRLLLINPKAVGSLDTTADYLPLEDPRIAAAITASGTF